MSTTQVGMTHARWNHTCDYLDSVFGREDEHLAGLMPRAIAQGIPDIAVSASVGRLLTLLSQVVGAKLTIELGTLAGYSGVWLARGLVEGGRLITVEPEPKHADFAQQTFIDAGVGDRVEIMRTEGLPALEALLKSHGEGSADLIFMDAIKTEYPDYLPLAKRLLRPGGLLVADNMLGGGFDPETGWWIDAEPGTKPSRDAADTVNRLVAEDPDFEAACVPIREGVMIARKRESAD